MSLLKKMSLTHRSSFQASTSTVTIVTYRDLPTVVLLPLPSGPNSTPKRMTIKITAHSKSWNEYVKLGTDSGTGLTSYFKFHILFKLVPFKAPLFFSQKIPLLYFQKLLLTTRSLEQSDDTKSLAKILSHKTLRNKTIYLALFNWWIPWWRTHIGSLKRFVQDTDKFLLSFSISLLHQLSFLIFILRFFFRNSSFF